ncbi:MAG: cell division protein SepF [Lachnospiraceae bacterium]|nr:cell division protein SepF [Lachnospiraceae bacterium]
MANIFDRFLNSMKLYDEDDEEEEDETLDYEEEEEEPAPAERPKTGLFGRRQQPKPAEEEDEILRVEQSAPRAAAPTPRSAAPAPAARRSSSVVPMRSSRNGGLEVCMVKPKSVEDGKDICDIVLSGRPVVINMEGSAQELAQRIIDVSSGICYSIKGNLQKISGQIFILTPGNVELSGDFQDALLGSAVASKTQFVNN